MNIPIHNIHTQEELQEGILAGVNKLADLVKVTLGARGRNVALPRPYGSAHVTKDGVSVANEVFLLDPLENMWAQTVKQVAKKTNDDAGDGTTTSTVIAQAIINLGIKLVREGYNPMEIQKGIDIAVKKVVELLKETAMPISEKSDKIQDIATISANGDTEIGMFIAEAFSKVGKEGTIKVESSKTTKTYVDIVEGMEIDCKPSSPYFVNTPRQTTEFENPLILIANKKLQRADQVIKILKTVDDNKRPIVFIADEVVNEAIAFLNVNVTKNRFPFVAINAPSFGETRKDFLEDICAMTGAQLISEDKGYDFDHITLEGLGNCEKVVVERNKTTFIKGKGDKEKVEARCEAIRKNIESEKDDMKIRVLKDRLAKLNGTVAILNVGANSEAEVKEKKDRIEDAINATKAASEEGIVAGGGVALYLLSYKLSVMCNNKDQMAGVNIVQSAIQAPIKQILTNAGLNHPKSKLKRLFNKIFPRLVFSTPMDDILKEVCRTEMGYDVREERFVNMIQAGIIDPKKVTRVSLENAASVAGLVLTTQGAMTVDTSN